MKIVTKINSDGSTEEKIDFGKAVLPDGRSIKGVLDENILLKEKTTELDGKLKSTSSILSKIIPCKKYRDPIELVVFIFSIIGAVVIVYNIFEFIINK